MRNQDANAANSVVGREARSSNLEQRLHQLAGSIARLSDCNGRLGQVSNKLSGAKPMPAGDRSDKVSLPRQDTHMERFDESLAALDAQLAMLSNHAENLERDI